MNSYVDQHEFIQRIAPAVGWFFALAALLNVGAAAYAGRARRWGRTVLWLAAAAGFAALAGLACAGRPLELPEAFKTGLDAALGPVTFSAAALAALVVFYLGRRLFVVPAVAWTLLDLSLVWMGLSLADRSFAAIVGKPDNLPIVAMVYLLGFFTWLATAQAVRNDDRLARGLPPVEKDYADTVLVWPDVIYLELIGCILGTIVLVVWSLLVRAPLEQPANPVLTPNPSKAPWYFLGLQEMLVYFPPWMAGVVLPALIIFGLLAIPYLDVNPKGNGYYTIRQRPFAYLAFQSGFLLWVLLILIGTFLRGPNWNFYGVYQPQDPHQVAAMTNISLSEFFWILGLGRSLPETPPGSGAIVQLGYILCREAPGLALLGLYYLALPPLLAVTLLGNVRRRMGRARYAILMLLGLTMLILPLKMVLVWTLHLNYLVSIPEYFFNF
jgi:hypothetical protein